MTYIGSGNYSVKLVKWIQSEDQNRASLLWFLFHRGAVPNWRLVPLDTLSFARIDSLMPIGKAKSSRIRRCPSVSCYTVGVPGATKMHAATQPITFQGHIHYLFRRVRCWPIIFQGQASAHPIITITPTSTSIHISGSQEKLQTKVFLQQRFRSTQS